MSPGPQLLGEAVGSAGARLSPVRLLVEQPDRRRSRRGPEGPGPPVHAGGRCAPLTARGVRQDRRRTLGRSSGLCAHAVGKLLPGGADTLRFVLGGPARPRGPLERLGNAGSRGADPPPDRGLSHMARSLVEATRMTPPVEFPKSLTNRLSRLGGGLRLALQNYFEGARPCEAEQPAAAGEIRSRE